MHPIQNNSDRLKAFTKVFGLSFLPIAFTLLCCLVFMPQANELSSFDKKQREYLEELIQQIPVLDSDLQEIQTKILSSLAADEMMVETFAKIQEDIKNFKQQTAIFKEKTAHSSMTAPFFSSYNKRLVFLEKLLTDIKKVKQTNQDIKDLCKTKRTQLLEQEIAFLKGLEDDVFFINLNPEKSSLGLGNTIRNQKQALENLLYED